MHRRLWLASELDRADGGYERILSDNCATFELVPLSNLVSNSQRCAVFSILDWRVMNQLEAAFLRPCSELM